MSYSICSECGTKIEEGFLFCPFCGKKLKEEKKEVEKRWITVIFTDIKGFTSLSETLDPEAVHSIVDTLFKELTDIIEKRGGYVDKYIGDAIMALFGAPKSYGDDTERALYSALEMQEVLKRKGITARIGINSGFVLAGKIGKGREGDYTAIGDTVNIAQRIESICEPGKIWVSESVYRELKDKFIFKPLGLFELKGKKEKVKIFEVISTKKVEEEDFTFFNRKDELSLLEFIFNDIKRGPFFVLITGEAGVGKTRLIKEFIRIKNIKPIFLFPNPFSRDFLSEWEVLLKNVEKDFPIVKDSLFYIKNLIKEKGFEDVKLSLIYLFRRILLKISENFNVIVIEKLGFWEEFSRKLIYELVSETEDLPLIFLITERKKDINFPQHERVIKIELKPLEELEFSNFLDKIFASKVKNKEIFYSRTRGNFSFLKTLLNSLEEEGFIIRENGKLEILKEISELDFPSNFLNLLQAWIDSLSEPAKRLVEIASFLGDEIPLYILKRIYEKSEKLMFEIALDESIRKGLLKESEIRKNTFRIQIPEIKEIVEERTLKEEKIKYFRLIAETLEEIDLENNFPHLIYKFYKTSGNNKKAKFYLEKAMDKSIENYNVEELEKFLKEYKEISSEEELIYYKLRFLNIMKKPDEILEEFKRLSSEEMRIKLLPLKSDALIDLQMHEENIKEIESIIHKVKERDIKNDLLYNLSLSYYYTGNTDKAISIIMELLTKLNFKSDKILLKILPFLGVIFGRLNKIDLSFYAYEIGIKKAEEMNDKFELANIYSNLGNDYIVFKGDFEMAENFYNKSLKIWESLKLPLGIAANYQNFAFLFLNKGNIEKALEFYMKARSIFLEIKRIRELYVTEQNIANNLVYKCMFREAEKFYLLSLERIRKSGNPYDLAIGLVNYSTMLLTLKKIEEALKLNDEALCIAEKNNFKIALSFIYFNCALIRFLKGEDEFTDLAKKAILCIEGIPVYEEHVKLRIARLFYFSNNYEEFKNLMDELEKKVESIPDLRLKLEFSISKTFLLIEKERENHLISLLQKTRETGNDRVLLKILYLLKDIRKSTKSLYNKFLNKVTVDLNEKEKEGFIEMLLLL
ncbi:MAG: adenylate/guanylate cyclase domain-containing protein [Candidatus Hydrothermales bacterium]